MAVAVAAAFFDRMPSRAARECSEGETPCQTGHVRQSKIVKHGGEVRMEAIPRCVDKLAQDAGRADGLLAGFLQGLRFGFVARHAVIKLEDRRALGKLTVRGCSPEFAADRQRGRCAR